MSDNISFEKYESDRGKLVIVVEEHKFRQAFVREIRWRYTDIRVVLGF